MTAANIGNFQHEVQINNILTKKTQVTQKIIYQNLCEFALPN